MSIQLFPPPARLTLANHVVWSALGDRELFPQDAQKRQKGLRGKGLKYEKAVQDYLGRRYSLQYAASPWLRYRNKSEYKQQWCQPDGLLVDFGSRSLTIIEIKLRHTVIAWHQLRQLYEPVLRHLFGSGWEFMVLEIVRWYDGRTPFPEKVQLVRDITEVPTGVFGVHIHNPKIAA